jgi:hypothetical protein
VVFEAKPLTDYPPLIMTGLVAVALGSYVVALGHCCIGRVHGLDIVQMITSRSTSSSAPAGYRFPREVIAVAVRWYLRYGLSYCDLEELLAERGIAVDHVTICRWLQTFTPEFIDASRPARDR